MMDEAVFPRSFLKAYPQAVRAEGCFVYTAEGRRYLDASGGAAVVTIGHGVEEVARAMAEQAAQLAYVHSSQFHTAIAEKLAERILALAPEGMRRGGRVYFTSGGSEPFAPMLAEWGHIPPCYCYRCPYGLRYPECDVECADELGRMLERDGSENVAAFIFEPVVGATLGAVAPPEGYVQRISEICREHGILLIADEVMTGMGRTGRPFAVEHWGAAPDMILVGKGIASGYAPLGAVIVAGHVAEAISSGSGTFLHGFTYNAHPVATAAGNAVLDYIERENLFARVRSAGNEMRPALEPLKKFSVVGDVRGMGLLWGVEFVRDAKTREPFPADARIASRIQDDALEAGIMTYPIQGCVDGTRGDHILLAPPFTITAAMIQMLAAGLEKAIAALEKTHLAGTGGSSALG